ncbi:hypothetical protein [Cellulosimicrobium funkei]|uniref:hypothetical protein n=1 Tax=Cellulosimicrobium funkei TaxID=264251 RepID=UPI0034477328
MRRLVVLLLAVGLLVAGPALAASAAPQPAAGPVAMKACAPAPEPASPFAGLPGKLYGKPATASDGDPFTDPGVKIADVYGYDYAWVDYDNGCIPGSDVLPKAQTGIANFLTAGAASVSAFTHSLFSLVVRPDFMSPLDGVLTDATDAIKGGFWDPWATVILILVAAGVLLAAARSEVSTAVTTVGWALLVLVGATFIMSYPVASAQAVDSLVQTTVAASARGIGVDDGGSRTGANSAQSGIDSMFDTINRDTYYSAWLEGTLGSADSAVAREYGPDLFHASHLTWSEAETVRDDPDAGRAIVDAKKALWVKTAAAVEGADSGAYAHLTGEKGRWDATAMVVVRVGLMMPFLVVAAIFIVIAYVATRVFVPLAPGLAVVGLLYSAQGWVIRVLKQVGRFIILGPVFFVAALANLLLDTAVLDSDLAFPLQLVIVAAIPFVLFKLLRPGHAMPGSRSLGRMARAGLGTFVNSLATRKAVASGVNNAKKKNGEDDGEGVDLRRDPAPYSYYYPKNGPVATGDTRALTAGDARPRELPAGRPHELGPAPSAASARRGNESPIVQSGGHEYPQRTRRELTAIGAGPEAARAAARTGGTFVAGPDGDVAAPTGPTASGPERPLAHRAPEFGNHPAILPEKTDVDLSAPADKNVVPVEVVKDRASPASLVEATTTYDADGNAVFQIWRPPAARAADEPEEQR